MAEVACRASQLGVGGGARVPQATDRSGIHQLYRTVREVEGILRGAPFKGFETEPGIKLYVAFLSKKSRSKPRFPLLSPKEALEAIAMKSREVFIVSRRKKNGFYGFPNNFFEKELGVSATSRNWSTLTKIVEFVRKEPDG